MTLFDTFAVAAILFSPFVAFALALFVLRRLGIRTEGPRR